MRFLERTTNISAEFTKASFSLSAANKAFAIFPALSESGASHSSPAFSFMGALTGSASSYVGFAANWAA